MKNSKFLRKIINQSRIFLVPQLNFPSLPFMAVHFPHACQAVRSVVMLPSFLIVLSIGHQSLIELRPLLIPPFGKQNIVLHLCGSRINACFLVLRLCERSNSAPEIPPLSPEYLLDVTRVPPTAIIGLDKGIYCAVHSKHFCLLWLCYLHRSVGEENIGHVHVLRRVYEAYRTQVIRSCIRCIGVVPPL